MFADAGAQLSINAAFTAGLLVRNLGVATGGFATPLVIEAGGLYEGFENIQIAVDAGFAVALKSPLVAVGVSYRPFEVLSLRAGYRWDGLNRQLGSTVGIGAGLGIHFGRLSLEYAFEPYGKLSTIQHVAFVFGGSPLHEPEPSASSGPAESQDLMPFHKASPPTDPSAEYQTAIDLYGKGEYDQAIEHARHLANSGSFPSQSWQLVGNCLYAKGDLPGALDAYKRSLAIKPDNPDLAALVEKLAPTPSAVRPTVGNVDALLAEGESLYQQKAYDQAWQKGYAAVQADANSWRAWQLIGNCQYGKGDAKGALVSYQQSLTINPSNPTLSAWVAQLKSAQQGN